MGPDDFQFDDFSGAILDDGSALDSSGDSFGSGDIANSGLGGFGLIPTMAMLPRLGGAGRRGAAAAGGGIAYNLGYRAGKGLRAAWELAKKFGPEAGAAALGIGVADFLALVASTPSVIRPHRRRRGISSRDIRTTRRVVRFTQKMIHDIGCVHHPRSFPARRRPGR